MVLDELSSLEKNHVRVERRVLVVDGQALGEDVLGQKLLWFFFILVEEAACLFGEDVFKRLLRNLLDC